VSSFESFKRAVLQIDNDYWKRIQDNKHKYRTNCFSLHYTFKLPRPDLTRTPGVKERPTPIKRLPNSPLFPGAPSVTPLQRGPNSNILGADDRLTPAKQQHHMSLGLCLAANLDTWPGLALDHQLDPQVAWGHVQRNSKYLWNQLRCQKMWGQFTRLPSTNWEKSPKSRGCYSSGPKIPSHPTILKFGLRGFLGVS